MVDYKHFSYRNCEWCGRFMTGDETEDSPYTNVLELTPTGEQIINGGFESALQHWTHLAGQQEEVVTLYHHSGTHSLHLKALSGESNPSDVKQVIATTSFSHLLSIGLWYKCTTTGAEPEDCFIVGFIYEDQTVDYVPFEYTASWQQVIFDIENLVNHSKSLVAIELVGSSYAGVEVYVDDVSVIDQSLYESVYLCGFCKKFASTTVEGGQAAMEEYKADVVGNAINPELSEYYKYPWI